MKLQRKKAPESALAVYLQWLNRPPDVWEFLWRLRLQFISEFWRMVSGIPLAHKIPGLRSAVARHQASEALIVEVGYILERELTRRRILVEEFQQAQSNADQKVNNGPFKDFIEGMDLSDEDPE